jgi:hypothetical protein
LVEIAARAAWQETYSHGLVLRRAATLAGVVVVELLVVLAVGGGSLAGLGMATAIRRLEESGCVKGTPP